MSQKKYRAQLKESSYYNGLYDKQHEEGYGKKKARKNPLLKEINKSGADNDNINLTATFELLTNSILLMGGKGTGKEDRNYYEI